MFSRKGHWNTKIPKSMKIITSRIHLMKSDGNRYFETALCGVRDSNDRWRHQRSRELFTACSCIWICRNIFYSRLLYYVFKIKHFSSPKLVGLLSELFSIETESKEKQENQWKDSYDFHKLRVIWKWCRWSYQDGFKMNFYSFQTKIQWKEVTLYIIIHIWWL